MSFNSFKDVVGHVENALKFLKAGNSRNEAQGNLAYGNDYYQGHNQAQQQQAHHQPPQHIYGQPPHSPPPGWSQHWDQDAHRYYYIEQSTGRSQWEPPVYGGYAQHQPSPSQQWSEQQARDSPRPHRYSNASPISPNQGGIPRHDSLPPGCSYDMKTGQIVSSMLPPAGHHSAPVKYW